ncbi:hypothetical protein A3860_26795 [Niastella vici]|uniref:DUF5723 domain-containing protein n=1 Tax=Niastella vici TaxID=1703345 RepID=A0A1V9FWA0_9BACT|nr:hypothetical protein [Niastella vici]OQP62622.1 hypothetical protein A3860_26795 [Niastella vici]
MEQKDTLLQKKFLAVLVAALVLGHTASAQYTLDAVDQVGFKKGIHMNGSFNLSSVAYAASGIPARRNPFDWFATGSINLNLFGISAPLSFSYTNAQLSYSQPFNRIKIIPQYKWAKLHLGSGYMNFNDYTLANHVFTGYGIELTPRQFKFMAMKGTLQQAVPYDPQNPSAMAYKRNAMGFLAGIDKGKWGVELSALQAKDDPNSIPVIPPTATVFPQSNLATSLKVKTQVTRWLRFDATYALSALTTDNRDGTVDKESTGTPGGAYSLLAALYPKKTNTSYFDAVDLSAGLMFSRFNLQLKYNRVAPGYTSLGAYYTNNDLENITVAPAIGLWHGKINLSANVGVQRNNLDHSKNATNKRIVASGNLAFNPSQHWSFNTNFSNFTMHTRVRPQSDPFYVNGLDSLNFYQINQTLTQMAMYMWGGNNNRQSILLTVSRQQAQDETNAATSTASTSTFLTTNTGYTYMQVPHAFSVSAAFNYYTNKVQEIKTNYLGPSLTVTKGFIHKLLPVNAGVTYNATTINGNNAGNVLNARLGASFSLPLAKQAPAAMPTTPGKPANAKLVNKPRHTFNCNLQFTSKGAYGANAAYKEWTVNTGYVISF